MSEAPLNALDIAAGVQAGKISAREVVDRALAQAEKVQDRFRSFIAIAADGARKQADDVAARIKQGAKLPLAGVPFAVKDLIDTAGLPTTCGSKVFAQRMSTTDAPVVRRLQAAGGIMLGKLNMHECAFGFTGENPTFGDCRNPWDATRIPGGSSSGSATAIALGICPLTLGSDTGGSIRMPAALCGLVGLKPTYGRVSRAGVLPLSWTMDHVGPLARTATEAALALRIMAGMDPADATTSHRAVPDYGAELPARLRGVKIGVQHQWFFEALEPEVAAATTKALDQLSNLGARIVEVHLPHLEEVVGAHRAVLFPEASSYHQPYLAERASDYGEGIRSLLLSGLFFPAVNYLKAQRARAVIRQAWAKVFSEIDCLLTPTTPVVATKFGQQTATLPGGEKPLVRAYLDLTLPFNFTGHPAVSVPCGFSTNGLPIGMQLVGKPFGESMILRVAHQYQRDTDWHTRQAPVA